MRVDPVTVEVIKGALIYAAEEMGIVLRNSAYSPNIKERLDFSCTVFDEKRRLAAQAEHIPVHLGSMQLAVQRGLERVRGDLEDGDMILFNDPYISGTHLPDITLICPIFYKGEIVGYSANKAHHSDVWGKGPREHGWRRHGAISRRHHHPTGKVHQKQRCRRGNCEYNT
jgi:N-methylhydantoinase B